MRLKSALGMLQGVGSREAVGSEQSLNHRKEAFMQDGHFGKEEAATGGSDTIPAVPA